MKICIKIPYGQDFMEAQIDEDRLIGCYSLQPAKAIVNLEKAIKEVLMHPIESEPLINITTGSRRILIVSDDNTRRTPVHRILPILLEELAYCGINDEDIKILFASGSHRPMSIVEIEKKIGKEIYERIQTFSHDCRKDLIYKGSTPMGTHIYINKLVEEADFIIGIGSIIPHRYCGWSGGGKIIQPGICGEETIIGTHLMITKDPSIKLGSMNNKVRAEINEVAKVAGLKFIINTILNSEGDVVGLVAGDPICAHKAGMIIAKEVCGVKMERADIVVISSFPEDLNVWQAGKALYAADLVVKEGGTVILVSPLTEGVGEHLEMISLMGCSCKDIFKKINKGEIEDLLSGAAGFAISQVLDRTKVFVVTDGINDETASKMRMIRYRNLQDAIEEAITDNPSAKIVCLKEGTEILPIIKILQ